jgi:nucleotide-binding universal stress UspA family protein
MRTILVPVDATSASENAVNVAIEWGKQYGYDHIILLKTSYESMFDYITIGEGYGLVNEENINRQQDDAKILLKRLRRKITERTSAIKVTTEISELPLLRCTIEVIKNNPSVELIVLGSDHNVVDNDSFVSANLINIARASPAKVLIVPDSYGYGAIRNILIPCDISNITSLDRLSGFKSGLKQEDTRLMLLNVGTKENTAVTNIQKKEWEENICQYFTDIPYNIHYSFDKDIVNGILSFTSSHKVDLIIALPGKHSFFYYLANKSISEGIYRNVDQAVLILK